MRNWSLTVFSISLIAVSLEAQTPPPLVGLGDSLGEGVQSYDAAFQTQVNGYLNLIAGQMGVAFPLPLIETGPLGVVDNVFDRYRLNPFALASNLAFSGADSTSILSQQASPLIVDEPSLVLWPRPGSQISIAQSLHSPLVICWIGANDVLGSVTAFDQLNAAYIASQLTSTSVFNSNYQQIATGLAAAGGKVVLANIPDVTEAAFLVTPQDLVTFLGSDYGLAQGSYTTIVAMLLIKLGIDDGTILQNPDYVLDPSEVQLVENAITAFNRSIATYAAQINAPVVDINSFSKSVIQNPPVIGTVTLTRSYLGGLFSLDGVHPSDIGYALVANAFIQAIDSFYRMNIPQISSAQLVKILDADPFVDFGKDLRVAGRPGVGLLETLGPYLGVSGAFQYSPRVDKALGQRFMEKYLESQGKDPNMNWTRDEAIAAFHQIFRFRNSNLPREVKPVQ